MAFQIKPNKKESENKTIRFPLELIEQINQAIKGEDVSFSNFVIQACQYALDDLQQENTDSLSNR
jgi:predicted HicB family RNase H-like nuclease